MSWPRRALLDAGTGVSLQRDGRPHGGVVQPYEPQHSRDTFPVRFDDGIWRRMTVRDVTVAAPPAPVPCRKGPPHVSGLGWDDPDVLVGAAVRGEPHAMDSLLRWINPLVLGYCRARLGRQERTFASADDVAQEVCLAVLKALPHYRDQGRPFHAFVYGIAAHKVADAHRAAARDKADPVPNIPEEPVQVGGPEHRALQAELAGQMDRLLDTLPDKQREIIVLRVVVGLSAEETAEAVGSTAGAVRVAQHRALTRLRKVLISR